MQTKIHNPWQAILNAGKILSADEAHYVLALAICFNEGVEAAQAANKPKLFADELPEERQQLNAKDAK